MASLWGLFERFFPSRGGTFMGQWFELKVLSARKAHPLTRGVLGCIGEVATLNVTRGCPAACAFCHARCYRGAPPPGETLHFRLLARQLRRKLESGLIRVPHFVLIGTAGDAFVGDFPELAQSALACMRELLARGIGVSLATRGILTDPVRQLLTDRAARVRVTVAITSLDEGYNAAWEAGSPQPQQRLLQIQSLQEAGVPLAVRVEPLIPFVNDRNESLQRLFSALAGTGVTRVQLGFLHLRPGVAEQLQAEAPADARRLVLGSYPGYSSRRPKTFEHLPNSVALPILRRVQRIARTAGIRATACACQNPGLPGESCPLAPPQPEGPQAPSTTPDPGHPEEVSVDQLSLFDD